MNDGQTHLNANSHIEILKKLYIGKCGQLEKAKLSSNHFRYQVLRAEAASIKAELAKD